MATVRGIRAGKSDYGCLVFTEQALHPLQIDTSYIYRELLKKIVGMFTSRQSPLEIQVTVEIVAFIQAAPKSGKNP